ncbi:hypothetical protein BLA29_013878, partial [Euroglyphus maynei]
MASFGVGLPIMLGANTSPERIPELCIFYNSNFIIYSSLWSFYVPCIMMQYMIVQEKKWIIVVLVAIMII